MRQDEGGLGDRSDAPRDETDASQGLEGGLEQGVGALLRDAQDTDDGVAHGTDDDTYASDGTLERLQFLKPWSIQVIVGRKHSIATDAPGLLLAVVVCAASVHENSAGIRVLEQAKAIHPTITMAWVYQGFKSQFIEHAAALGGNAEGVTRNPEARGFHVLKRRWVGEIC